MNPFADLPSATRGNSDRQHFITREDAQRVLDACPDAQWRLLFALSRKGRRKTGTESGTASARFRRQGTARHPTRN